MLCQAGSDGRMPVPFQRRFLASWLAILAILFFSGCQAHKHLVIVCIGDSLTVCGGEGGRYTDWLQKRLPSHRLINKGIGGDTLAGGRARFDSDVLSFRPDIVIIELGANDFRQNKRPVEQLKQDLDAMIVKAEKAGAQVVIASCFGRSDYPKEDKVASGIERYSFADKIGRMEEDVCLKHNCFYVPNMEVDIKPNGTNPYWESNSHPNKKGNEYVAKRIFTELKKAVKISEYGRK
jgi:lysophospholipase L1-like esterase